jgi:hypothetical protein
MVYCEGRFQFCLDFRSGAVSIIAENYMNSKESVVFVKMQLFTVRHSPVDQKSLNAIINCTKLNPHTLYEHSIHMHHTNTRYPICYYNACLLYTLSLFVVALDSHRFSLFCISVSLTSVLLGGLLGIITSSYTKQLARLVYTYRDECIQIQ